MAKSTTEKTTVKSSSVMKPMVSNSQYSATSFVSFINNNFALIFVAGLFFLAGFLVGSLWTENQFYKSGRMGTTAAAAPAAPAGAADPGPQGPTEDQLKKVPAVTADDYQRGNKNAKVTLIEYSDFECPFCARFHPTMVQLMAEYGDKINWVYRHYPLSFHPNAQKAGEAAECVVKQKGKEGFWQYADKIFEENNKLGGRLSPEVIESAAVAVGANKEAFKKCLDSGEMAEKVKGQLAGGTAAGISGTPGTIILTEDGKAELIPGALPLEQVKVMVDKYL